MKSLVPILSAFLLLSGLAACGSKGPLVLPDKKPAQDAASAQKSPK